MARLAAPSPGTAQIWWLDRRNFSGRVDDGPWLTPAERSRRDRLFKQDDRERFALGRFLARRVLAGWCGCQMNEIEFEIGAHGRPLLASLPDGPSFSLTHSGSVVALAVAPWPQVGLDTEVEDAGLDLAAIARSVFDEEERAALSNLQGPERVRLFFSLWTLKEAYLKAIGLGFSLDPRTCAFHPFDLPRARRLSGPAGNDLSGWHFQQWRVSQGYPLALALRSPPGIFARVAGPLEVASLEP